MKNNRSKFTGVPIAPHTVSTFRRAQLTIQGRIDANKYMSQQDYTRTHAIIRVQKFCRGRQGEQVQWLISSVSPIRVGNSRIRATIQGIKSSIESYEKWQPTSGRDKRKRAIRISKFERELTAERSQLQANQSLEAGFKASAEDALKSWVSYYGQAAAIYERARQSRIHSAASAASAAVPEFESLELPDFDQFDADERGGDDDNFNPPPSQPPREDS
jgi:hypothetical protein